MNFVNSLFLVSLAVRVTDSLRHLPGLRGQGRGRNSRPVEMPQGNSFIGTSSFNEEVSLDPYYSCT